jgi:hypothetical protein
MTVQSTLDRKLWAGNGVATTFTYDFKILNDTDLVVYHRDASNVETLLELDTDYSVTGMGDEAGGDIEFPLGSSAFSTLASDETLIAVRRPSLLQETDLRNQGDFYPETIEDALDHAFMLIQQLQTAPVESDTDTGALDCDNYRLENVANPQNAGDAVNLGSLESIVAAVADGQLYTVLNKWHGTTDGVSADLDISGGTNYPSDVNAYMVVVDGVLKEPTDGFTIDLTPGSETVTLGSVPLIGLDWWVITTGYVRQLGEYPAHDHDTDYYLKSQVTQIIGLYEESAYLSGAYTAALVGDKSPLTAWNAAADGAIFLFRVTTAHTTGTLTFAPNGLAAKSIKHLDATNPSTAAIKAGDLLVLQFDYTDDCLYVLSDIHRLYDGKTTARLPYTAIKIGAGKQITGNASAVAQEETNMKWVNAGEKTLSSSAEWTGLPSNITRMVIPFNDVSLSGTDDLGMQLGHSGAYMTSAGDYIGNCRQNDSGSNLWAALSHALVCIFGTAAASYAGKIELEKLTGNTWNITVMAGRTDNVTGGSISAYGKCVLGGTLTRLKLLPSGANTFDAGTATLYYYGNPDA